MREARTDRRSLRTRQALTTAMLDLMRDRRYDAITVQDIVDRADVGRSTFYIHFTDKDDLLVDGVRFLVGSLTEAGEQPELPLLHHIGAQPDLYRIMARGRALPLFLSALHEELTALLTPRLEARMTADQRPAIPPPLLAAMITSMFLTLIRTWLESGAHEPAETIHRMYKTAAAPAIRAGLRSQ